MMADVTVRLLRNQIKLATPPRMSITIKIVTSIRENLDPLRRPTPTAIVTMPKIRYKMPKTRIATPLTFDARLAAPAEEEQEEGTEKSKNARDDRQDHDDGDGSGAAYGARSRFGHVVASFRWGRRRHPCTKMIMGDVTRPWCSGCWGTSTPG
jgi:hypothetical protein